MADIPPPPRNDSVVLSAASPGSYMNGGLYGAQGAAVLEGTMAMPSADDPTRPMGGPASNIVAPSGTGTAEQGVTVQRRRTVAEQGKLSEHF
jgi:hypothetical protein